MSEQPKSFWNLPEKEFLTHAITIYSVMAGLGLAMMTYWHSNLSLFIPPPGKTELLRSVSISGLSALVLLVASYFLHEWFASYRELRSLMMQVIGPCQLWVILVVSLCSSVGEEILFRGALEPTLGVIFSGIIFALLHVGPKGPLSIWSLWAFAASLLLSKIVETTGSILPAIGAHFLVNLVSMTLLRKSYLDFKEQQKLTENLGNTESKA